MAEKELTQNSAIIDESKINSQNETIKKGQIAENRVITYSDTLITAMNPRINTNEPNSVPDPHPYSRREEGRGRGRGEGRGRGRGDGSGTNFTYIQNLTFIIIFLM